MVKFDVVVGNPPYQEDTEGTSAKQIYPLFMDASYEVADISCLITPARFLFNAGKTSKKWNEKMLSDTHFKVIQYEHDSSKVFENTGIAGGIAISYRNANKNYGEIGVFSRFDELQSILSKVSGYSDFKSLMDILYLQNKFNLESLYDKYPDTEDIVGSKGKERRLTTSIFSQLDIFTEKPSARDDIRILGLIDNKRYRKYIPKAYIDNHTNLNTYKVLVPKSNGTGLLDGQEASIVIGKPELGQPKTGYTQSFIGVGSFELEYDALSALKYVKTKFARSLLGVLKITQDNPPRTWAKVPLQDFTKDSDIDWSKSIAEIDQQLYEKYGLSEEEITFIETHVKEMD